MRYAQIRSMDISNGEGVGVSLFVQGCHFHCKECFNPETWDFNGGKEWTNEIEQRFLALVNRPFIKRVSILGGEPLAEENINTVFKIIAQIPEDKQVWVYTGYKLENFNLSNLYTQGIDILVDGQYEADKKDLRLNFKGSSNQRVIDIAKTVEANEIVLWQK